MGAQSLELGGGKECTLVRRCGERDIPGCVGSDEGANKSDVKECLLGGGRVGGKKLWDSRY